MIQDLYRFVKESALSGRIVFLEDYDMNVARHLVQGVDVWLNTPRRPMEASGTSGEKAGLNGVLNFSVLDGWWREGYNGENGWAIGGDADYDDPEAQDAADAEVAVRHAGTVDRAVVLRRRCAHGHFVRLDAHGERIDSHHCAHVQHGAHVERIHHRDVRAGGDWAKSPKSKRDAAPADTTEAWGHGVIVSTL